MPQLGRRHFKQFGRQPPDELPAWPFDAPTLGRLFFYLALPLASWVAGAFVERGVDSLLGP